MPYPDYSRRAARALALVVLLGAIAAFAGDAAARPKAKKLSGSEPRPAAAMPADSLTPVRFFTINQVLAKRDGLGGGNWSGDWSLRNGLPAEAWSGDWSLRLASLEPGSGATDAPGYQSLRTPAHNEPFGLVTFRAPEGLLWVKWRKVETDIRADKEIESRCRADLDRCTSPAARRLISLIDEARGRDGRARIDLVNRSINAAIRYTSDLAQHGVPDLWSSPLATLASGQGDCEDYAIAKYMALQESGVSPDDLRLLLVRDRAAGQDHAVLAVRHERRWLILDNRHSALNEAAELRQFTPLFAIDQHGVKLFAAPYVRRPMDAAEQVAAPAAADRNGIEASTPPMAGPAGLPLLP